MILELYPVFKRFTPKWLPVATLKGLDIMNCLQIDGQNFSDIVYTQRYIIRKTGGKVMGDKDILTIRETSRAFDFPEYAIRRLVKDRRFPTIQVGNRAYISRSVFENFLESGSK